MNDITDPAALAAYWKEQVDAWKSAGTSQIKFCQANELPYHRFVYWRQKFERGPGSNQVKRESGGFATAGRRAEINGDLTLSLPNGLVLRGRCADTVSVVPQLLDEL